MVGDGLECECINIKRAMTFACHCPLSFKSINRDEMDRLNS